MVARFMLKREAGARLTLNTDRLSTRRPAVIECDHGEAGNQDNPPRWDLNP